MSQVDQHDAPMEEEEEEEEPYVDDEKRLLSQFKEKLSCRRPSHDEELWVLWSATDHPSVGITHKIKSALQLIKLTYYYHIEEPVLIQFWAPVTIEGRRFLTTSDQPFGLGYIEIPERLCLYRNRSVDYNFVVDVEGESEENDLGFPARVFRQKLPESTLDVRYYSPKQHPWCESDDNLKLLALPVFGTSGNYCVGVFELVTVDDSYCISELCRNIRTVLEAVELKCSVKCNHFDKENRNEDLQQALDEISEGLKVVCTTHDLPLAHIWIPCKHCTSFPSPCSSIPKKSPGVVMSKISDRYYVTDSFYDADFFFLDTCVIQLQKGQGVAGRAYLSHNSSLCKDITQFSLTDYPLVHYARHHKLVGCFAICLRSSYTGEDDYILEFFLPHKLKGDEYPQLLLESILATMKQHFPSFKVASGEQLGVELSVQVINFSMVKNYDSIQICQTARSLTRPEALQNGGEMAQVNSSDPQLMVQDDATNNGGNIVSAEQRNTAVTRKTSERTPQITREVLEQHFGRNLNDAAESLGISRSTLKRICREHEISRWPHHKTYRVNGSLSKQAPPRENSTINVAHTRPHVTAMQDVRRVTIKAAYIDDDNFIKFQLSFTAGMVELEEEIVKRLKLKVGCFRIKYRDEDGDWVLLACDWDLQNYINASAASGNTTIKMVVEIITN